MPAVWLQSLMGLAAARSPRRVEDSFPCYVSHAHKQSLAASLCGGFVDRRCGKDRQDIILIAVGWQAGRQADTQAGDEAAAGCWRVYAVVAAVASLGMETMEKRAVAG